MSTEANYVKLVSGVPKEIVATDMTTVEQKMKDPATGFDKIASVLVLQVIKEDGQTVLKPLRVLASKFQTQLRALKAAGRLFNRRIRITKYGSDFTTEYQIEDLGPA